ncbi:MAG: hypothetical protein KDC02_23815, partial [Flavobacteriales bacterium]|nr:hypothetical protein [Flavobacteriales bacterium]
EAVKSYPSQNAKLKTQQGTGTHMKTDIFTGKMWYGFKKPGEPFIMAGFPVEVVRDILAQNKQGVEPEVDLNMVDAVEEKVKTPDYENVVGQDDLTRFDSKNKSGKKRRGSRDRRDRQRSGDQGAQAKAGPKKEGGREGGEGGATGPRKERGPRPEGQGGQRRRGRGRGRGDKGGDRGSAAPQTPPTT